MGDATGCARAVVGELIARGVREVVLSPGSRSAPLAYVLHAADQAGWLRLHVRVDERTAGFLALGLAKGSAAPVAVVTTSGTAVAHLHPAVLEAAHAHLPLFVVSADRPRAWRHAGANQTTQQTGLFDPHLRASASVSDAESESRAWAFEVARLAVAATGIRSRWPGPVHLNLELSDPLTPTAQPWEVRVSPALRVDPSGGHAAPVPLAPGPRTVIVAGDLPPEAGRRLAAEAAQAGVPLLAEPSSNARTGSAAMATGSLLLASAAADGIERVVVHGRPTLSRSVQRLLGRDDVELVVISPFADWIDPGLAASVVTDGVTLPPGDAAWLESWRAADADRANELAALLASEPQLSGPVLAAAVWRSRGPADLLFVGASNPVRDLNLAPISAAPPTVYANRGLSGIDGSISTTAGLALAHGRSATALIGDVTAVHDLTGLVIGPNEPRPDLRIVIANDDGGSIFATLEHGAPEHSEVFERVFGTSHGVNFAALAEAVGSDFLRVDDLAGVETVLKQPIRGIQIVEAVIDRTGRRALNAAINRLGSPGRT